VPTINAWTTQRGFRLAGFQNIAGQRYGLGGPGGAQPDRTDAES
jgi:hypothetical protein